MTHLLDSNTCIRILRRGPQDPVARRLAQHSFGSVSLCSVVRAELLYGALRSNNPTEITRRVEEFCAAFAELPFGREAAEHYASIRNELAMQGTPIGPNDLMIAAIARANGLVLVTHNQREFTRVPDLAIEDWEQ